jgi:hypothetical protein
VVADFFKATGMRLLARQTSQFYGIRDMPGTFAIVCWLEASHTKGEEITQGEKWVLKGYLALCLPHQYFRVGKRDFLFLPFLV